MCGFHYDQIKNKYGNNLRLLFTDTESLIYEYVFEGFSKGKEMLDFSDFPAKSKHNNSKKLVVGYLKKLVLPLTNLLDLTQRCIRLVDDNDGHEKQRV